MVVAVIIIIIVVVVVTVHGLVVEEIPAKRVTLGRPRIFYRYPETYSFYMLKM